MLLITLDGNKSYNIFIVDASIHNFNMKEKIKTN